MTFVAVLLPYMFLVLFSLIHHGTRCSMLLVLPLAINIDLDQVFASILMYFNVKLCFIICENMIYIFLGLPFSTVDISFLSVGPVWCFLLGMVKPSVIVLHVCA